MMTQDGADPPAPTFRDWQQVLSRYRQPSRRRSLFELILTGTLFIALWVACWLALSVSYILALAIVVPAAGCLVRLFMIQHDCGHGAFSGWRTLDDWVGRCLGVLTLTPYDVWRHTHAVHHATTGHLERRGMGDIHTLTIDEYLALPRWRRLTYRVYRHPLTLFGIGPAVLFLIQHRLPLGLMRSGARYWISAMATNAGIVLFAAAMIYAVGFKPFLLVHMPIILLAASIGVWLFYVQHQFEDTYWADGESWSLQEAALRGSSHYHLPGVLGWFTANIGLHHIHHLSSRIPHYRLPEVLRDHPELAGVHRLTILRSLSCVRLSLWDDERSRLVSFAELARDRRCAGRRR